MSPFFRGSVRPSKRHPRPWSLNPRLNPDLGKDDARTSILGLPAQQTDVTLPVFNGVYTKPAPAWFETTTIIKDASVVSLREDDFSPLAAPAEITRGAALLPPPQETDEDDEEEVAAADAEPTTPAEEHEAVTPPSAEEEEEEEEDAAWPLPAAGPPPAVVDEEARATPDPASPPAHVSSPFSWPLPRASPQPAEASAREPGPRTPGGGDEGDEGNLGTEAAIATPPSPLTSEEPAGEHEDVSGEEPAAEHEDASSALEAAPAPPAFLHGELASPGAEPADFYTPFETADTRARMLGAHLGPASVEGSASTPASGSVADEPLMSEEQLEVSDEFKPGVKMNPVESSL